MPAFIDKDGFPFWGNPSPQKPSSIPGRQVRFMVEDASINQVFNGRADEINLIQVPVPRQARAEGQGANNLQNVGKYGSTLYDQFMRPFDFQPGKGSTP